MWIFFILALQEIPSHVFLEPQKFVTLRDRYRNMWRIKAREVEGTWYLLDGWAKFVADCSIDAMDMLRFAYSAPGLYDVNILGQGGDMKEGVGYRMTDVEPENEDVDTFERVSSGNNNEGGSKNPHKKKRTFDYLSRGIPTKGYCSVKRMKPLKINESDNKGKKNIIISSEEDSEYRPSDSYDETCEEDFRSGNGQTKRPKSKTRDVKAAVSRKRVDYLGKDFFSVGGFPRPELKYFVTRIKPSRMNELHIPKEILTDENLKIPRKIQLVDTDGNTYSSRLKGWLDGRSFFRGGWRRLCRRNHVTEHDFCVCEFGEGDNYGYLFISFLRIR